MIAGAPCHHHALWAILLIADHISRGGRGNGLAFTFQSERSRDRPSARTYRVRYELYRIVRAIVAAQPHRSSVKATSSVREAVGPRGRSMKETRRLQRDGAFNVPIRHKESEGPQRVVKTPRVRPIFFFQRGIVKRSPALFRHSARADLALNAPPPVLPRRCVTANSNRAGVIAATTKEPASRGSVTKLYCKMRKYHATRYREFRSVHLKNCQIASVTIAK